MPLSPFFVPEVKSLVLCACRHGDLRKPVVLGGLYNGKDKPRSDHVRKREIASGWGIWRGIRNVQVICYGLVGTRLAVIANKHVLIRVCQI